MSVKRKKKKPESTTKKRVVAKKIIKETPMPIAVEEPKEDKKPIIEIFEKGSYKVHIHLKYNGNHYHVGETVRMGNNLELANSLLEKGYISVI